jgi:hypothetical protein
MESSRVKSALLTSIALAIVACTNTIPNNPIRENFQDLDNEYSFTTKELTESYIKRKLDKWLDTANEGSNPDGPKLVKEIAYAKYKYPELFCQIMENDETGMLSAINSVIEVSDRKNKDESFRKFLEETCEPEPVSYCPGPTAGTAGEFLVNTYTLRYQRFSSVAMDQEGDFVVTWGSEGYSGSGQYGIYAQRYNSDGSVLGSEFQVSSTSGSPLPKVAMNNSGSFVITWSPDDEVYAKMYDSSGVPQGPEFQVNTFTTGVQSVPSVEIGNTGDFVISWESGSFGGSGPDGDRFGIYARRYDSAGTPQDSEFLVNTNTFGNQLLPSIAMDNAGDFLISWTDLNGEDGNYGGIFAQRYDSSGVAQGSEFQVNTYTDGYQKWSSAAMDDAGDFVITWTSYSDQNAQDGSSYGVFAQRYDSTGTRQGSEFQVNTYTTRQQSSPTAAMDSDGDFVITWHSTYQNGNTDFGPGYCIPYYTYGIFARRYNAVGQSQGTEFQVNTYPQKDQRFPATAMDSDGDFVVTWTSYNGQDGSGAGVYGKRYNSSGISQAQ